MKPTDGDQKIAMTPEAAAAKISDLHGELFSYARKSFDLAYEIGGMLIEQKSLLGRGHWGAWTAQLPFTHRQANNYMRLHRLQNEHRLTNIFSVAEFYSVLAQLDRDADVERSKLEKISNFPPSTAEMSRAEAAEAVQRIQGSLERIDRDLAEVAPHIQRFRGIRDQRAYAPEYSSFAAYLASVAVELDWFQRQEALCDAHTDWKGGGSALPFLTAIVRASTGEPAPWEQAVA
jgi:hypothetical protein